MKIKKIFAAAGFMSAVAIAPMVNAAPVSLWDYTVTLAWTDATFTGGTGATMQNDTLISWGAAGGDHTVAGQPATSARSGVEISDASAVGSILTNGAAAPTNTITHFNNAISSAFSTLSTAQLLTTLTLTPVTPEPAPALSPLETTFTANFTETPNAAPCGFTSSTVCDDIFVIALGALDFSFDFDGVTYDVAIFETTASLLGLSDAACARAGAPSGCIGFQTPERLFTPASFAFTVSTVLLPEPGILALLGLGLVVLGVARRTTP
jgi:hypothetical protein